MSNQSNFDPWELPRFRNRAERAKSALSRRLWEGWKRFGMALAKVNLYILLFIIYWTVFAATAVIAKVLSRDWLRVKLDPRRIWHTMPPAPTDKEEFYRQF